MSNVIKCAQAKNTAVTTSGDGLNNTPTPGGAPVPTNMTVPTVGLNTSNVGVHQTPTSGGAPGPWQDHK